MVGIEKRRFERESWDCGQYEMFLQQFNYYFYIWHDKRKLEKIMDNLYSMLILKNE